jgi:hypothetical protein
MGELRHYIGQEPPKKEGDMGVKHVEDFSQAVQAAVSGPYFVVVDNVERAYAQKSRTLRLLGKSNRTELAALTTRSLPGCCGICLIHGFSGGAKAIAKLIGFVGAGAKTVGYGAVLLTLVSTSPIAAVLLEAGWTEIRSVNGKTGNTVSTFYLGLGQPGKLTAATEGE